MNIAALILVTSVIYRPQAPPHLITPPPAPRLCEDVVITDKASGHRKAETLAQPGTATLPPLHCVPSCAGNLSGLAAGRFPLFLKQRASLAKVLGPGCREENHLGAENLRKLGLTCRAGRSRSRLVGLVLCRGRPLGVPLCSRGRVWGPDSVCCSAGQVPASHPRGHRDQWIPSGRAPGLAVGTGGSAALVGEGPVSTSGALLLSPSSSDDTA